MILVTGGCGYIGSHTVLALLSSGYDVVVLDNLSNSSEKSLKRVSQLTNKKISFVRGDVRDVSCLDSIFCQYSISSVIHFAGLKSVAESVSNPLEYYDCNVSGTIGLLKAMLRAQVYKFVFSSSATVYGSCSQPPYNESAGRGKTVNPYGETKAVVEGILESLSHSNPAFAISILRYFNPVGAHHSGLIGESPVGIPNNLMPYITQVAVGKLNKLRIFGDDYDTPDGTCRRDYIHVMDLARGHINALEHLSTSSCTSYNLGTGIPTSVLELVNCFSEINGVRIPFEIVGRRPGDLSDVYAGVEAAENDLNWKAEYDIRDIVRDSWRWQTLNPNGYS